ncbi:MAG: Rossmann-like domain-containing protein [Desulfobacterales bacterium]
MTIQQRIKDHLLGPASEKQIADVRIGLGYTAVMLENGQTGVACTPIRHLRPSCTSFTGMLPLIGRKADELLTFVTSPEPLETAIGLATANALANIPAPEHDTGDVLNAINLGPADHVGMVGHFAPLVKNVRDTGARLTIFEQINTPSGALQPAAKIPDQLPGCTVCLFTATSIINHTFDQIIDQASNCRSVILLGASTPLIPALFTDYPVTGLSGVLVTHPAELLHIVSCGGGMRRFKGVTQKVNIAVSRQ